VCDIENGPTEAASTTYWAEQGLGGGYSFVFGIYADGTIASNRSTPTVGASSGCNYGTWTASADGFTTTGEPASLTSIVVAGAGAVSFTATDNEGNVHAPVTFHLENLVGENPFSGCVPKDAGADGTVDAGGGG
jgi:hypothetical protein